MPSISETKAPDERSVSQRPLQHARSFDQGHDIEQERQQPERHRNRDRAGAARAQLLLGQFDAAFRLPPAIAHRLAQAHAAKWPNSPAAIRSANRTANSTNK